MHTLSLKPCPNFSHTLLEVKDTGQGISPTFLPHVFNLFAQERRSEGDVFGGLGLGLPMVKSLVEMHGGVVRATSRGTGQGSTFTVVLPVAAVISEHVSVNEPVHAGDGLCGLRILLIEDNADAAHAMVALLARLGHVVERAANGEQALTLLEAFRPNVTFVDIGLPGIDGYEVARRIRSNETAKDAILVALTGYGMEEDRRRANAAGFNSHLTKPVDLGTLRSLLKTIPQAAV